MAEDQNQLQKTLSFPTILLITINSIMGTGIYFLPKRGIEVAGPSSLITWAIMSAFALYIAAIFGELVSMFPRAGGVYEYAKNTYGRSISFLVGWLTLIAANITIAMLIVGAIQYLLQDLLPPQMGWVSILICILFLLIFNYMAYRGMKTSAVMLTAFAFITIALFFIIIAFGLPAIDAANFSPFFPHKHFAVLIALFFIAETFFGWESAANLAEETKDAKRVMPKAIMIATGVIALISLLLVTVAIGSTNAEAFLQTPAPIAFIATSIFGAQTLNLFTLWVYVAVIGSVACWVVSTPRLILSLTRDKLFLSHFEKLHPKFNSPHRAILFQALFSSAMVVVASGAYQQLLEILVPVLLILYSMVLFTVVRLRFIKPQLERPFKVWFGKSGPIIMIVIFLGMLSTWLYEQGTHAFELLIFAFSLIFLGIPVYLLIEMYYDPRFITRVNDKLSYLQLMTEWVSLPHEVRKDIVMLLGDVQGKVILEFGCNVGTLTLKLAKEVGPEGKVYAIDHSTKNLRITQKRVEKQAWVANDQKHGKVFLIHDSEQTSRIHPQVPYADTVVSVGMLSYIQDINKVLRELNAIMPNKGQICFVEFGDFFNKLLPNVEWLSSNDKIEEIFRSCGFSVHVMRKKGLFWNYIYVYGIKSDVDVPYI